MKPLHYYIAVALTGLSLILSLTTILLGQGNQAAQLNLQKRQNEIQTVLQERQAEVNKGSTSNQVGSAILQDMAAASMNNPKMKEVLTKNGYNVTANPAAQNSPSPAAFKP